MNQNCKIFGTLGAVVLAMAMLASTAHAAEFHSNSENTTISGSQTTIGHLKTGTWDVTCEETILNGTMPPKTTSAITLTPFHNKCHQLILFFTFPAQTKTNGCDYTLLANRTWTTKCPAGAMIEIVSSSCTIKIGAQTITEAVEFKNSGEGIQLTWTAKNIKYSQSGSACPTKEGTDAELSGAVQLNGTAGGKATKIWYE